MNQQTRESSYLRSVAGRLRRGTVLGLCCAVSFVAGSFFGPPNANAQVNDGVAQQLQQMKDEMDRLSQQLEKSQIGSFQLESQRKIESRLSLLVRQFSSGQQSNQSSDESQGAESQSGSATEQGTGGTESNDAGKPEQPAAELTQREFILKAWGLMPERLRKDSNSGITPKFLPGYERAIQKYYERMAR